MGVGKLPPRRAPRLRRNCGLSSRCGAPGRALLGLVALAGCLAAARPALAEEDVHAELECLALTIYFEARGEPDEGKLAVGHVVMNRALHPAFPQRVCEVVREGGEASKFRCQFTWWCDGRSDEPTEPRAWEKSKTFARVIYWDYSSDPTDGALWYHAEGVRPAWRRQLARGPQIGRHVFYRSVEALAAKLRPRRIRVAYRPW